MYCLYIRRLAKQFKIPKLCHMYCKQPHPFHLRGPDAADQQKGISILTPRSGPLQSTYFMALSCSSLTSCSSCDWTTTFCVRDTHAADQQSGDNILTPKIGPPHSKYEAVSTLVGKNIISSIITRASTQSVASFDIIRVIWPDLIGPMERLVPKV